jgi:hypothetical protein
MKTPPLELRNAKEYESFFGILRRKSSTGIEAQLEGVRNVDVEL